MTVDERLKRLTERHDALTETVELMASLNRAGFARLEKFAGKMARSIDSLAPIVRSHEYRLDSLEGSAS